ncbi:MAG: hybrid sensor histidine kinase/response regulator [Anaerolineae bacterium]|nr:hybrid sensor histidine kinase/response regulator [Anaerolineae bacterium]NUQ04630.1 hybrid sensor histidine kinase/response regulator [Anaerolineae bacterium]
MNKQQSILYIEDDAASRSLVERALRYGGYHVQVADCGLDGIDIARRTRPDLILVDINLPDLTGREITTMLRADPPFAATPIVALTAMTLAEHRELTQAAGITGYMTKPIDIDHLLDRVAFYLTGGRDVTDAAPLNDAQTRYIREVVSRLETRIRDLERMNRQLERFDRMKDVFIQLTAHELRTPLTLVIGYNRLLEENPELRSLGQSNPNLKMLFEGLTESILRMQNIIDEILTISRIMTNQIELTIGPCNLGDLTERALQVYARAIGERRLTVQFNKTQWNTRVVADWELLSLAFRNLISNAIKFTPDGGVITLACQPENDRIRLIFRDTGIGISPEDCGSIFERFFSSENPDLHSTSKTSFRGGGIGLGLAVVKGIIEAHGGQIAVESPGFNPLAPPGTTFSIVLPLVATPRPRARG